MEHVTLSVSELSGAALDWAVAKAWQSVYSDKHLMEHAKGFTPSTDWAQGGPIIERENISTIRITDKSIPDAKGFWQGKYEPQWGAVVKDKHSLDENHSPQGDHWGMSYHIDQNAILGPTPLIAAMRCYVASKLGDKIAVPLPLIG